MLPLQNRLKKDKDFQNLFSNGTTYNYQFLYFRVARNSLHQTRFGFIVSKKVSRKAVVRNKIKRKLRAVIRDKLPMMKEGFDVAVVVKKSFQMDDFKRIEQVITVLLSNSGIYKEHG